MKCLTDQYGTQKWRSFGAKINGHLEDIKEAARRQKAKQKTFQDRKEYDRTMRRS